MRFRSQYCFSYQFLSLSRPDEQLPSKITFIIKEDDFSTACETHRSAKPKLSIIELRNGGETVSSPSSAVRFFVLVNPVEKTPWSWTLGRIISIFKRVNVRRSVITRGKKKFLKDSGKKQTENFTLRNTRRGDCEWQLRKGLFLSHRKLPLR